MAGTVDQHRAAMDELIRSLPGWYRNALHGVGHAAWLDQAEAVVLSPAAADEAVAGLPKSGPALKPILQQLWSEAKTTAPGEIAGPECGRLLELAARQWLTAEIPAAAVKQLRERILRHRTITTWSAVYQAQRIAAPTMPECRVLVVLTLRPLLLRLAGEIVEAVNTALDLREPCAHTANAFATRTRRCATNCVNAFRCLSTRSCTRCSSLG